MQTVQCIALGVACLWLGGHAGNVRREPAHLRTASDSDAPWKAAMQASISNFALPAPASTAMNAGKGDKGDKGKKTEQPVSVQVPQNDIDLFIKSLSSSCGHRFQQTLQGKGGDLHTFGAGGSTADAASCKKLDGTLCATQAHIIHERSQGTNGRKMESTTDVSGNSCLPSECMSKMDLEKLSQFMHTQAKGIIPGEEHQIELKVDCTANGGTTAAVGVKSGSISVVPTAVSLLLAVGILASRM